MPATWSATWRRWRSAWAVPWRASRRRWRRCSASIRPASSRAIWPSAWRCSSTRPPHPTPVPPGAPDILMHRHPDGGWIVELNADTLPRVLVNSSYHARISRETKGKKVRHYIAERFNSANWLVKSLHQRAPTILKVATEIVRQQEAFFLHGVQHLKPLIRRDIAEAIGMH